MSRTFGIEREWFIKRNGEITPAIGTLLPQLYASCENMGWDNNRFGFELFAGQVEDRTPPTESLQELLDTLQENEKVLKQIGALHGLQFACVDYVNPEDLGELAVNPFDRRHYRLWQTLDMRRKISASQVAAIHLHISASVEEAVRILNYCRKEIVERLCQLGDLSKGKRLSSYREMAQTNGISRIFRDSNDLLAHIDSLGGEKNVWDMVRYKPSTKTIEFRMFGATEDYNRIISYFHAAQEIIANALKNNTSIKKTCLEVRM